MTIISAYEMPHENQRQTIIVLSENDFNQATLQYEDGEFLLSEDICYLKKPTRTEIQANTLLAKLNEDGLLKAGSILIQQFYDKEKYVLHDDALKEDIRFQMNKFKLLCQFLGAKEVRFKIVGTEDTHKNISANVQAAVPKVAKGEIDAQYDIKNWISQNMDSHTIYPSSIANFEEAGKLMQLGVFRANQQVQAFYEQCRYTQNAPQYEKVRFSLAENVVKQFNLLASIKAPIYKKVVGEAKFQYLQTYSTSIEIEYEVTF